MINHSSKQSTKISKLFFAISCGNSAEIPYNLDISPALKLGFEMT